METGFQVPSALGRPFYISISGVIIELGKAPFVASWIFLSKSGTANNPFFCNIYLILWWKTGLPVSEYT